MVIEHWLLAENELALLKDRTAVGRLGFALCLKFFQQNGYFPKHGSNPIKVRKRP